MTPFESSRQKFPGGFTIVGTGRLGSSLALRLHAKGYVIRSLFNKSMASCERLAKLTETDITGTVPEKRSDVGDLVFLCLADDQISEFVEQMAVCLREQKGWSDFDENQKGSSDSNAQQEQQRQEGPAWIHTSGATPAEVLQPLIMSGMDSKSVDTTSSNCQSHTLSGNRIASFHPVQTFTRNNSETAFDQCFVTLQGDRTLCNDLKLIVRAIGARPLVVDRRQKMAIHLGAVFVCNYLVPLFAASQQILKDNEVEVQARELFGPIVQQTLAGLLHNSPEDVLTGPILRGDSGTIIKHLDILKQSPEWERIYRELGRVTLHLARNIAGRDGSSDEELKKKFTTTLQNDT